MTRTPIRYLSNSETRIDELFVLGDGSFIIVTGGSPNDAVYGPIGLQRQYQYHLDARGRVLRELPNGATLDGVSLFDASYFFSDGQNQPMKWHDAAGVVHPVTGDVPLSPFRDRAGRFWGIHYNPPRSSPGQRYRPDRLEVFAWPFTGGRQITVTGKDPVIDADAGCDGAVWALTQHGQVWRVDDGGRTAHMIAALPLVKGRGPAGLTGAYGDESSFLPMPDGSVWLSAAEYGPRGTGVGDHIVHLSSRGMIGKMPTRSVPEFDGMTVGPDGALWNCSGHRLVRTSAQGTVRTYRAPCGDLDLGPGPALWFICGMNLCSARHSS